MTVTIKALIFLLYCTNKVTAFVQGTTIRITCSAPGTLPAWVKDSVTIANEGDSTINTGLFPRITYDTDQSTLILSNLESGDAGTYTCSFFAGGSGTFIVTVDVLSVTAVVWPETRRSFAYITTACQSGASVKWVATVKEKNNEEIKLCTSTTTNNTGCPVGKEQLTTLFEYIPCDNVMCLEVKFKYELLHSSTGDTPQIASSNGMVYEIERCCFDAEICDYLFFTTDVIASVNIFVLCIINREKLGSLTVKIGVSAVGLFVVGIAWFIPLRVSVLPVLPEGDCIRLDPDQFGDQCSCGHPIAFAVIMALLTCVGGAMAGYIIYKVKQESNKDKDPDSKGHDNYEMNDHPKEKNRN